MTPELKEHIEAWLQKAENDLMTAQRLLDIAPMILDTACFRCQQAIEKSLKAFLIYNNKEIVKTHDIAFLRNECAHLDPIFSTIEISNINDYAVDGRNPDFAIQPDANEARAYYQLAIQVDKIVRDRIVFS
jgi:HEPN domain-containing protein